MKRPVAAGADGTGRGAPSNGEPPADPETPDAFVNRTMHRLLAIGAVDARSRFVQVDGARLHFLEAGRGPAVVLVQGAGGGAANWYRVMGALAERFRVLAPDLPGFGLSRPARRPEAPLGPHTAGVIERWLHEVGVERCRMVGTSFGGLAALRVAQRTAIHIDCLVLLDSVGLGRDVPFAVRLAGLPLIGRVALHPTRRGTEWLLRSLLTADLRELDAGHQAALIDYLLASAVAGDARRLARALRLFAGLRGQREVLHAHELAELDMPALVLWGERDGFLPVGHARRAVGHLPRGRLRVIPRAGHSPNWEAPDAVLDTLLPFLAGERLPPP